MFSNLEYFISLYVAGSLGFIIVTLNQYHQDKPWYTWTGRFSATQAYWIGLFLVIGIVFVGWWYLGVKAITNIIRGGSK